MRALRAEWVKLRSDPGLVASAVGLALATVAVAVLAASRAEPPACPDQFPDCAPPVVDRIKLAFSGVHFGQLFAVVLATLLVAEEYTTGLMVTTLVTNPRRLAVATAKAVTAVAAVILTGAAAVAASAVAALALLPRQGFTADARYPQLSLTDPALLRAAGGSVLYLGLVALFALGITFVVRDTTAALAIGLTLLYLLPFVGITLRNETVARLIERYATHAGRTGRPDHDRRRAPAHRPLGRAGRPRRLGGLCRPRRLGHLRHPRRVTLLPARQTPAVTSPSHRSLATTTTTTYDQVVSGSGTETCPTCFPSSQGVSGPDDAECENRGHRGGLSIANTFGQITGCVIRRHARRTRRALGLPTHQS